MWCNTGFYFMSIVILYIYIYINELCSVSTKSQLVLFADDTNRFINAKDPDILLAV